MDDRRRDGGTNFILRTKGQGRHLTLNEHDNDDNDDENCNNILSVQNTTKYAHWDSSCLMRTVKLAGGRQHEAKNSFFVTLRMNLRYLVVMSSGRLETRIFPSVILHPLSKRRSLLSFKPVHTAVTKHTPALYPCCSWNNPICTRRRTLWWRGHALKLVSLLNRCCFRHSDLNRACALSLSVQPALDARATQLPCPSYLYTRLFKTIVGVLTTCHTQYTVKPA